MAEKYVIDSDALDLVDETASVISKVIIRIAAENFAENVECDELWTRYIWRSDVERASMSLLGEDLWNRMMDAKEAARREDA